MAAPPVHAPVDPQPSVFPFGRPVVRRRPSAKSRRRVFVLGATPSALCIAWWSPARKSIKALPVDNEPAPFWNGSDERAQIDAWKRLVGFRTGEWGEVETAGEVNGKAGRWLDAEVLAPLGVTRDEVCLSTCVDTYLGDAAMAFAVNERYQPVALETGLPEARLPLAPPAGALVELAVTAHRERLLRELSMVVPELVVTLGNLPLRVMRGLADATNTTRTKNARVGPRRLPADATYGALHPLVLGTRTTQWLPLAAPETGPPFDEVHERWKAAADGLTWAAAGR